jgi:hypothetical protein
VPHGTALIWGPTANLALDTVKRTDPVDHLRCDYRLMHLI